MTCSLVERPPCDDGRDPGVTDGASRPVYAAER